MQTFIKDSRVYDIAKWTAAVFLPAINVLWVALASTWGWQAVQEVSTSIAAINAFLGAVVGVSSAQYNKAEADKLEKA